ncbi:hypothetical protein [Bradyrhizobium sp. CCBAU 11361]|uniref:hypothetical protein n=1 Tax=Bradyrhizobium sp. CCBAU 11361 TaxID=1630812 RepID=UPI002306931A|nr:hypothetical protein [Bradyrhizobium sp. CCBAU 11361]
MRKLILIAAMSLLATETYAGGSRSLSLTATNSSQQATEQPAATATAAPQTTPAPAAAQTPSVQTATTTPTSAPPAAITATTPPTAAAPVATAPVATTPTRPTATPVVATTETAKPKRRQPPTEARVIRELHRHGILVKRSALPNVVLAKARTHYPREEFGEERSPGTDTDHTR